MRKARDGEEALRVAEEFRPEVILMDIGMPRMGGLEPVELEGLLAILQPPNP